MVLPDDDVAGTTPLGLAALEAADWSRLFHAYAAATDTPAHLRALLSGNEQEREDALEHLYGAVLHQGTVYPATAVAVRVVAGVLHDDALRQPLPDGTPLLVGLLRWLGDAFDSAQYVQPSQDQALADEVIEAFFAQLLADDLDAWRGEAVAVLHARGGQDLLDSATDVIAPVLPFLGDDDPLVRQLAADALGNIAKVAPDADRATVRVQLQERLTRPAGRDERCQLVLALAAADADVTPWLADPDQAVRSCAALGLPSSEAATAVLLEALEDPAAADEWFDERPGRFQAHVRFHLLEDVLARGLPFAEVLPAALRLVKLASHYSISSDVEPLLLAAFPDIDPRAREVPPARSATELDDAQRRLLLALVANGELWDPRNGNAKGAFRRVGLPHDRKAIELLAGQQPSSRWLRRRR